MKSKRKKRKGQGRPWEQWMLMSPIMPTHPEILRRIAEKYPMPDSVVHNFEEEYRLDSGDAADYRNAISHLRSM